MTNWLPVLVGGLLCVGAIAGGFGWLLLASQHRYEARPTVTGRVLAAEVVRRPVRSNTFGAGGRLQSSWLLEVRYAYTVADRSYTVARGPSTRISIVSAEGSGAAAPPAWLRQQRNRYPAGKPVTVHYRRADPADSVLEIDRSSAGLFLWIAAIGSVLALLCAAVVRYRKAER